MITIADVAKEAGVSVATVSRVLNKNGPVSPAALEKVNLAIRKLNYQPNVDVYKRQTTTCPQSWQSSGRRTASEP